MKHVVVRYRVKPDRAEQNVRFVQAVFAQLERERPAGLEYASYRSEDGLSFVHVASYDEGRDNPLTALASFAEFTAAIRDRCEEPPSAQTMSLVGAYRR